jgi:hypothetical protein
MKGTQPITILLSSITDTPYSRREDKNTIKKYNYTPHYTTLSQKF